MTNSTGSQTLSMGYEAIGQALRTNAGSTQFTNNVLGLVADTGNGARYTRLPGGALISQQLGGGPISSRYYLTDRQNSVIALLDSTGSGSAVANYYYSPYGETTATGASSNNPFRYVSGYQDTITGLYKLGIRYYDPTLGRFTQQDPTGQEFNGYSYARGAPCTVSDPTGADTLDDLCNNGALTAFRQIFSLKSAGAAVLGSANFLATLTDSQRLDFTTLAGAVGRAAALEIAQGLAKFAYVATAIATGGDLICGVNNFFSS